MTEKRLIETKVTTTTTRHFDDGTEITDSVTTVTPALVADKALRYEDEAPAEVVEAIQAARPHVDSAIYSASREIAYAQAIVRLRDLLPQDLYDVVSSRQAAPIRGEVLAFIDATEEERAVLRQAWAFRYGLDWIEEH